MCHPSGQSPRGEGTAKARLLLTQEVHRLMNEPGVGQAGAREECASPRRLIGEEERRTLPSEH